MLKLEFSSHRSPFPTHSPEYCIAPNPIPSPHQPMPEHQRVCFPSSSIKYPFLHPTIMKGFMPSSPFRSIQELWLPNHISQPFAVSLFPSHQPVLETAPRFPQVSTFDFAVQLHLSGTASIPDHSTSHSAMSPLLILPVQLLIFVLFSLFWYLLVPDCTASSLDAVLHLTAWIIVCLPYPAWLLLWHCLPKETSHLLHWWGFQYPKQSKKTLKNPPGFSKEKFCLEKW